MNVEYLKHKDIIRKLENALEVSRFANEDASRVVIISEYLRISLFQLSLEAGHAREFRPVNIQKIGHAVRRQLAPIWGSLSLRSTNNISQVRELNLITWTLKQLSTLGDCIHLGNGYWIPGPVRTVRVPSSNYVAITGGLSTKQLKNIARARCLGLGRVVNDTDDQTVSDIPRQQYVDWMGRGYIDPTELDAWAKRIIEQASAHGTPSSFTFQDYEIFASAPKLRYQNKRLWIPAITVDESQDCESFMLCRMGKPSRYFVGELHNGILKREYFLNEDMDRRYLELGFYKLHGSKATGLYRNNVLTLYPYLPTVLQRHFMMYAVPIPTNVYSTGFVVPKHLKGPAHQLLESYGYILKGDSAHE